MNHTHKITIADHKDLERHRLITKFLRIFVIPVLNRIPASTLQKVIKKSSHYGSSVIKKAGTTHSLEAMYTKHQKPPFYKGILNALADSFWHNIISQPKAIRNRLKLVERAMEGEIVKKIVENKEKGKTTNKISILSVGGGSCRALMHTIDRLKKGGLEFEVNVVNVDKDVTAIELGKEIAEGFGLLNSFRWINDDARNIGSIIEKESMDIVEMVGLLDYFSDDRAREIFKSIHNILKRDGLFIVANVYPNSEMPFVENVGWPKMYYRDEERFINILEGIGFSDLNVILEPLKVHVLALLRK